MEVYNMVQNTKTVALGKIVTTQTYGCKEAMVFDQFAQAVQVMGPG